MRKEEAKLTGVPETMLIPIRARYLESKKANGILSDPKSIEILDRIECDFSGKKERNENCPYSVSIIKTHKTRHRKTAVPVSL